MVTFLGLAMFWLNAVSFGLYGWDKHCARRSHPRIPNAALLSVTVFAGFGAFVGMRFFRHKTRQPLYRIAVPVACAVQAVLLLVAAAHV